MKAERSMVCSKGRGTIFTVLAWSVFEGEEKKRKEKRRRKVRFLIRAQVRGSVIGLGQMNCVLPIGGVGQWRRRFREAQPRAFSGRCGPSPAAARAAHTTCRGNRRGSECRRDSCSVLSPGRNVGVGSLAAHCGGGRDRFPRHRRVLVRLVRTIDISHRL